jgi:flagellar motor switch protein FliN
MILDIPVQITVELGRTKISIRNLLQLAHGSVVELDGLAGEPMDVLVNGTLIAQGEVVVVNDKFGIRLTDIITPAERMRKLNRSCSDEPIRAPAAVPVCRHASSLFLPPVPLLGAALSARPRAAPLPEAAACCRCSASAGDRP